MMPSSTDGGRIPLSKIPIRSSREVVRALERLGAKLMKAGRGSHALYCRETVDGHLVTATVIRDRREMDRRTLRRILEGLEISLEDFLQAL